MAYRSPPGLLIGGNAVKPKMKRKDLLTKTEIWNAVITVLSEYDLSTEG